MIHLLKASFYQTLRKGWLSLLFYAVSVLLMAVPVWVFYKELAAAAGHRLVLNELVKDFDFMLFSDFFRKHGKALRPALGWAVFAGFLGSLIYTFLSGGAVSAYLQKGKTTWGDFLRNSARLFPPYLLLLVMHGIFLFVIFLVCGLFFFVFALLAEGSTERGYVLWLLPPFVLLALGMTFGLCVSFYAKVFLALENRLNTVDAFWKAISYVFKNRRTLAGFWLLIGLGVLLSAVYVQLDKYIGMRSSATIVLMLVVQQLLVFSRSFLKNWNYALAAGFVMENPVELWQEQPVSPIKEPPDDEAGFVIAKGSSESDVPEKDNQERGDLSREV